MPTYAAPWTRGDVDLIKLHYVEHGPAWVAHRLGRTERAVRSKAEQLGVSMDRSADRLYRRTLEALRQDAADHASGYPSAVRVARQLGMARCMVERRLNLARQRGDLPWSRRAEATLARRARAKLEPADPGEPGPEEVAAIEARLAEERGRKDARPRRWTVPVLAHPWGSES